MRLFVSSTISLVLFAFIAAIVVGRGSASADYTIGTPITVPNVNSSANESWSSISADGLELYLSEWAVFRPGGHGGSDIWVATRQTTSDAWGDPVNLGPTVNSWSHDYCPSISADGLTLYFCSMGHGGYGGSDIFVTTRATRSDPWREPENLGPAVNGSSHDELPSISADGRGLFFQSNRPGGEGDRDIWVATRQATSDVWGNPNNLGATVNSSSYDGSPSVSHDGLWLIFQSNRPGGQGNYDLWLTARATKDDPWGTPVNPGPGFNTAGSETCPNISADGSLLYFSAFGSGSWDLLQVPILPVVDLNGDDRINMADIGLLGQNWLKCDSSCDMAPTPLGDGIVDVQDLAAIAKCWLEDYRLIAHWKLDETEGTVAYDSAGEYPATLQGDPVWQPAGGMSAGAIELDGTQDFLRTRALYDLGLYGAPFSALVWVKGSEPGRVILSQIPGPSGSVGIVWLGTDPEEGKLFTELMAPPVPTMQLQSDVVVTDGQWHHLGLVWDGLRRHLYVDGQPVAEDQADVAKISCYSNLHLGAGPNSETGTFFRGLIDDLRIYNAPLSEGYIRCLANAGTALP